VQPDPVGPVRLGDRPLPWSAPRPEAAMHACKGPVGASFFVPPWNRSFSIDTYVLDD